MNRSTELGEADWVSDLIPLQDGRCRLLVGDPLQGGTPIQLGRNRRLTGSF